MTNEVVEQRAGTLVPILLCFDSRILIGAGVTILSLVDHANVETTYDIRIFHPDLDDAVQGDLVSLLAGSRHRMSFQRISADRFADMPKNKGSWTEIVYYRLLASELLPDCQRVIYSDVDVFVRQDLAAIFNVDLGGCEWGGVAAEANQPQMVMHRFFPENHNPQIMFSGFMVMDLARMRANGAVPRYLDIARRFASRLKFFDLDVVNLASSSICRLPFAFVVLEDIYESSDVAATADYRFLKSVYSVAELEAARHAPAIIHFAGPRGKPWQRQSVPRYFADAVVRLPHRLRRGTLRDWRKKWLSLKGWRRYPTRTRG